MSVLLPLSPPENSFAPTDLFTPPPARIYGQPLELLPHDLYIPPDALEILLEAFEGPMDLLLYLIRKANINILDIPMAQLTRQYLDYVELMRGRNLELAAEYLVMAATLIEIKSRMLLPRPRAADDAEEDPRAELARRLLEYEQIRLAARKINDLEQAGRDFFWTDILVEKIQTRQYPEVSLSDLQAAWHGLLQKASLTRHHSIARAELSVREHMTLILRRLRDADGLLRFESLFDVTAAPAELVVHFIALLELARERLIEITQTAAFQPIYIRQTAASGTEAAVSDPS